MLQTWQLCAIALGFIVYLISVVKILRQPELCVKKEARKDRTLDKLPIFRYRPSPKKAQTVARSARSESVVKKLLKIVRRDRNDE